MNDKIILASSSPRRKDILESMGLKFEIIPSDYEENLDNFNFDYKKIEHLALQKAISVANSIDENALVIGADTVVVLDGQILGKPQNEDEAKNMLKSLSNKTHFVVTSHCVINSKTSEQKIMSVESEVKFNRLSEEMIDDYIAKFKPYDKAGSYGIQELPDGFIKSVSGSLENIIGLCPVALAHMLREFEFVNILQ